jgi:hypothetical protein
MNGGCVPITSCGDHIYFSLICALHAQAVMQALNDYNGKCSWQFVLDKQDEEALHAVRPRGTREVAKTWSVNGRRCTHAVTASSVGSNQASRVATGAVAWAVDLDTARRETCAPVVAVFGLWSGPVVAGG